MFYSTFNIGHIRIFRILDPIFRNVPKSFTFDFGICKNWAIFDKQNEGILNKDQVARLITVVDDYTIRR